MLKTLFNIFLVFILSGCFLNDEKPIVIATNSWIGYSPLFYAKEKGYLDKLNIKLITTVSLGEASEIYSVGKADMVTTTQHEFYQLKRVYKTLVPVILIDRSYGGDMILSNKSIDELKNSKDKIYVYLEIDSINSEILTMFLKKYNINKNRMVFIDGDQSELQDIDLDPMKNQLIVTYTPYDITFLNRGFKTVASTKDLDTIIVIDSICTTIEFLNENLEKIKELNNIIDKSIKEIESNPKEAFKYIAPYLNNISYKDFQKALSSIKWINHPSSTLLEKIDKIEYKKDFIIR